MAWRMMTCLAIAVSLAAGVGAAAISRHAIVQGAAAGWQEIAWPFPRDAWPAGRAFRCGSSDCGGAVEVYVRPKPGFCNCRDGVTGDEEVDAVSDLDMISPEFSPEQAGEPVSIGGMTGRTRRYTLRLPDGTLRPAAGFAMSQRCDLVVAASQGQAAGSPAAQRSIAVLLGSEPILGWIRSRLGKG